MPYGDDEAARELFFRGVALKAPFSWESFSAFRQGLGGITLSSWYETHWEQAVRDDWGLSRRVRESLAEIQGKGLRALMEEVDSWPGEVFLQDEEGYPGGLKELEAPPAAVHVVGDGEALNRAGLAVVGSRKITAPDARMGRRLVQDLARQGAVIVSGGALGSDGVAHRAALDLECATVAVLPAGLDRPTPASHRELFAAISRTGGALVSEYAPGTEVRKYHFRRRNALIAAMSRGVLVLRAREKSGSLLTVEAARKLGRPCAAIPGHPEDPESKGCLAMLRGGARLVASREDLLGFWQDCAPKMGGEEDVSRASVAPLARGCAVLETAMRLLDEEGRFSLEALGAATDLEVADLQVTLLHHELAGRIERVAAGYRLR